MRKLTWTSVEAHNTSSLEYYIFLHGKLQLNIITLILKIKQYPIHSHVAWEVVDDNMKVDSGIVGI